MTAPFRISLVSSPEDIGAVAELFREYADGLGIDLTYQSFADELASLPGKYSPPDGVLLLARKTHVDDGEASNKKPIGCVAVRPLPLQACSSSAPTVHRCELKRLYVRPETRGTGLGEALARKALGAAAAQGYTEIVMDTLSTMEAAKKLYHKLGFVPIPAYYETPITNIFFRLDLAAFED